MSRRRLGLVLGELLPVLVQVRLPRIFGRFVRRNLHGAELTLVVFRFDYKYCQECLSRMLVWIYVELNFRPSVTRLSEKE